MNDFLTSINTLIPRETEFWSAIAGAIVGGGISFIVQIIALRAGKRQRDEDRRRADQALAHALIFKVMKIHSTFNGIHRHIEECVARKNKNGGKDDEHWQFYLPLANPPSHIHFSADEMGMLLAQKDNTIFNSILPLDEVHNTLLDAFILLNTDRRKLTEMLKADSSEGNILSGALTREQYMTVRPKMIEFNSLFDEIRRQTASEFPQAAKALDDLTQLLRNNLGLKIKIEKGP